MSEWHGDYETDVIAREPTWRELTQGYINDHSTKIKLLENRITELEDRNFVSYFLFRVGVATDAVCHNARSKLCKKCCQPDCDLAGWKKK